MFGPASLSYAALWSLAATAGTIVSPSRKDDVGRFLPLQKILEDETVTGSAEFALHHDSSHRVLVPPGGYGRDHPFAGGESVGFDDKRVAHFAGSETLERFLRICVRGDPGERSECRASA